MKPIVLALSAVLCAAAPVFAQQPQISYSQPFEEPEGLESKVIQCRNGNTFLFTFMKKDGIKTALYDKNHKLISDQTLKSTVWNPKEMGAFGISSIFEIGDNLILFIDQLEDRVPRLYRMSLNSSNGKVTEEKKITEMPAYPGGAGYAMAFGHVDAKEFKVEKDPASDCYAVVASDGFAHETEDRIHIMHFNGKHELLSEAKYVSPESRYKYTRYLAMTVDGDRQVFLCSYAFNTGASGGKMSKVYFSKLKAGQSQPEHKPLEITQDFKSTTGALHYNPNNKQLQLLTVSYVATESKSYYSSTSIYRGVISAIDPEKMSVIYSKLITGMALSRYGRTKLEKKDAYHGMPQDFIIHSDNSMTLALEGISLELKRSFPGAPPEIMSAEVGDMGILHFDAVGQEKNGFIIPKEQKTRFEITPLSLNERRRNKIEFERKIGFGSYANTGFYSFDYVSTPTHNYVIFNDHPDNRDKDDNKKRQNLVGISDAETICYSEKDGQTSKFLLFGDPNDKKINRFSFISAAHYLPETQTYATMVIERDGKKKQARLAWATFQ